MCYSRPPGTVGQPVQSARRHSRPPGLQRKIQLNKNFRKTHNMSLPRNWSPICKLDSKLNKNDQKNT
uniref:Uncharacterized protein n=1 Tax=Romanomermis culicivorax TaxID=13658 RepID=A0A915J7P0_ROMCU